MKKASVILCLCAAFFTHAAYADKIKNSKFLELSEAQQHWWYLGAFTALGHVAFLEDEEKGKCVWDWLYEGSEDRKKVLMDAFEQYPDHTPTSIVIASLRRDCGIFLKKE